MINAHMQPPKKHRRLRVPIIFLWVVILALAGALGYTIWLNQSLRNPEAQTKLAEQASQEIIDGVGRLIVVPTGKPTVATITDITKLKESNSEFYKDAQNGDVLLIYETEAIIYRKAENKIVAVAPVVVNPGTPANSTNTTTSNVNNVTNGDSNNTANETE